MIRSSRLVPKVFMPLALVAVPLHAANDVPWPVRYRQDMARLTEVEWRLRMAAGSACPRAAADLGIALDDRRAYASEDWPVLAEALGMGEEPVIAAVASGAPAAQAGLAPGDVVKSIGGNPVSEIVARRQAGRLVAEALLDEVAAQSADQAIAIVVERDGAVLAREIMPARHCAARLVLVSDRSVDAHSDTRNVAISTGLATFARTDDELAMAAGHEIAHIINGDRRGGGLAKRRAMEDSADTLGLRLLRCAGYDAARGLGLFERLGNRDWLGFLRAPTHRSFKARVERLRAEDKEAACPIA